MGKSFDILCEERTDEKQVLGSKNILHFDNFILIYEVIIKRDPTRSLNVFPSTKSYVLFKVQSPEMPVTTFAKMGIN